MIGTLLNTTPASLLASATQRGFWMPEQASTVAESVDWVYMFITGICAFFFVLIVVLMIVFMVKYRRQIAQAGSRPQGPSHHTPLEVTWSVIPLILVIAIFYIGMKRFHQPPGRRPSGARTTSTSRRQKWSWSVLSTATARRASELARAGGPCPSSSS